MRGSCGKPGKCIQFSEGGEGAIAMDRERAEARCAGGDLHRAQRGGPGRKNGRAFSRLYKKGGSCNKRERTDALKL